MNKYNVRAIRKDMDDCIRNHAWHRLQLKLESIENYPELLQAVVLGKSKLTSGSVVHALVKYRSHAGVIAIIVKIAQRVPAALVQQDALLQTPLHIAIGRDPSTRLVEAFLEIMRQQQQQQEEDSLTKSNDNEKSKIPTKQSPKKQHLERFHQLLSMVDRKGDTPLLKAVRNGAYHFIPLLLQYDLVGRVNFVVTAGKSSSSSSPPSSVLVCSKKNHMTPLWYVARSELHVVSAEDTTIISADLQMMLLATYFAIQLHPSNPQRRQHSAPQLEKEWILYYQFLEEHSPWNEQEVAPAISWKKYSAKDDNPHTLTADMTKLTLRALITCAPLLGKYAIKLLDLLFHNNLYQPFLLGEDCLDKSRGNSFLHCLCQASPTATSFLPHGEFFSTHALMMDVCLNQLAIHQALSQANQEGNLPLHVALLQAHDNVNLMNAIRPIVTLYPDALLHANQQGEVPLHLALKLLPPLISGSALAESRAINIVDDIWKTQPTSLELRDGPTKLLPFQLAACGDYAMTLSTIESETVASNSSPVHTIDTGNSNADGSNNYNETNNNAGNTDGVVSTPNQNSAMRRYGGHAAWTTLIFSCLQAAPQVLSI